MEQSKSPLFETEITFPEEKKERFGIFKGKAVLVVNTASKCGFTVQYQGLQALYDQYSAQGLVVLALPCNQFGEQEPGDDVQIGAFCEQHFHVRFPLLAKADVKGPNQCPLFFQLLTESKNRLNDDAEVEWNFEKFLVDRSGKLVGRYSSKTLPFSPELIAAIEAALG